MAGPWEKYQEAPAADGPWTKYAESTEPAKPKNKDYEEGKGKPGWQQGLASVINGPLMGFGDEVLGAVGGAIDTLKPTKLSDLIVGKKTFAENYRANLDTVRGMQDAQREQNPIFTGATQIAASAPLMAYNAGGAVANGLRSVVGAVRGTQAAAPVVNAARTTGIVANSLRAGATGAGYGAVGGAGNSTADTMGGVAVDAGMGAGTGFVLGAGATPVIAGMGSGGRALMSRLSDTAAGAYAREKVAQALARDARGNTFTSGQANPLDQVIARANKLGPEATVVDAAGKNTNQLLDTLATLPGRAKDQVANLQRQRTAGVGERLRGAADSSLGTNGQRMAEGIEGWAESRRLLARPLYDEAHRMQVQPTPNLEQIVRAAEQLGAGGKARQIATANRAPYTLNATEQHGAAGSSLMNNPQASAPAQWSVRDLDHLKQGLDDIVQANMDDAGKLNKLGFAVDNLRKQLVTELDRVTTGANGVSPYRIARETYAGPSALIDAAKKGKLALSKDDAAITGMTRDMTQSEMEAFRLGAFEALRAKLGTQGGQTNIINMWKEPATREKLQVIFGDERSFREFAAAASREGVMKRIQSVGTGSQTASRQAGMGDLDASALSDLGSAVGNAKAGNLLGALGSARNAWTRVGTPEPVRNEMSRILLSRGPEAQSNLNELRHLIEQINEQNVLRTGGVGLIGSQLGNRLAIPQQ